MENNFAIDFSLYTSSTNNIISEYNSTNSELDPDKKPKLVLVASISWKPKIRHFYK
jgi:hypothetical protein